jgi:hypothetical protein
MTDFLSGNGTEFLGADGLTGIDTETRFLPINTGGNLNACPLSASVTFSAQPAERMSLMRLILVPSAVGLVITSIRVKTRELVIGAGGVPVELFDKLQAGGYYNMSGVLEARDNVSITVQNTTAGALTLGGVWVGKSDAKV